MIFDFTKNTNLEPTNPSIDIDPNDLEIIRGAMTTLEGIDLVKQAIHTMLSKCDWREMAERHAGNIRMSINAAIGYVPDWVQEVISGT